LLCDLHSGLRPEEIAPEPAAPLERLGLLRQLAESRRATILRVAESIRAHAAEWSTRPNP
jgi:sulfur transfer protein SufE